MLPHFERAGSSDVGLAASNRVQRRSVSFGVDIAAMTPYLANVEVPMISMMPV